MTDQLNEKIINNFIASDKPTHRQLHQFVKAMGTEARGGDVESILLDKGMTPCVAREWGNAHRLHDALLTRTMANKYRKETSAYGKRGQASRRIIKSGVKDGRWFEFHATKGERNYYIPKVTSVAGVVGDI